MDDFLGKYGSPCLPITPDGFAFGGYDFDHVCTLVGARLRVDSREKAMHLGKIMLSDYKTYMGK